MSTAAVTAPLQGPVSMSLPFSAESARTVRDALTSWLVHHGAHPHAVADARLIATELVSNALHHASPLPNGTMLVRWRMHRGELQLSVSDGGGATAPAVLEASADDQSGRGLSIVNELTSRWWVERQPWLHAVHVDVDLAG